MLQLSKGKESLMEKKKVNLPQKGAGRRLADRLEKLGQQKPPKALIDKLNQDDRKKVAAQKNSSEDLDI
jgi:hypothetical protein